MFPPVNKVQKIYLKTHLGQSNMFTAANDLICFRIFHI